VLAFACALAVNAASFVAGGAAALTVGATVGTWVRAGLSSGRRDSQEAVLGMWLLGTAPNNALTYGGDSDLARGLQSQEETQFARNRIAAGELTTPFDYRASGDGLLVTAGNVLRDGCTYALWASSCLGLGNQTKAGVGSWSGEAVANPNGTTTFTATNDISLRSAIGILPATRPFLEAITPSNGPFSTVRQEISWTE
jgi:hypothetical protein